MLQQHRLKIAIHVNIYLFSYFNPEKRNSLFTTGELWEIDRSCLMEVLADNRAMLEDELEPYRFLPRFRKEGLFSQEEVDLIKGQNIRRNRANEFLRLLQGKGKPALEVFVDELKKLNESYILQQLFPSTSTSTQCRGIHWLNTVMLCYIVTRTTDGQSNW